MPYGWYLYDSNRDSLTTKWNPETDPIPEDAPDTMVFHLCDRYLLVYDWGGKGGRKNDTLSYFGLAPITIPPPSLPRDTPTVADYEFDGWNKDPNGGRYDNTPLTLPCVLYARWAPRHQIIFNTQGGTAVSNIRVREGSRIPRPEIPVHATDTNMVFWGWYQDAGCDLQWNFHDVITKPTTLYARWYSLTGANTPAIVYIRAVRSIMNEDLPGYYWWTKDGEDASTHYNPCPRGWSVPTYEDLTSIQNTLPTLKIPDNAWSSTYADEQANRPYIHRAWAGNGQTPVVEPRPVRCVRYAP
jgi:hypothetical protein